MSFSRKVFISIFLYISFPLCVFASVYNGFRKLNKVETEHFCIIYPENESAFAVKTADDSERILSYLNELFGTDWNPVSFPIIITDDDEDLNAYFSPLTANHIVLLDTIAGESEIEHYSDQSYSILLHEMTHALTLNYMSDVKKGFQTVIGDGFNNSLFLNQFVTEGLAVMAESISGEGRVNDPFAMNSVVNGLRDRESYGYRMASGAVSRYPAAKTYYITAGAFFMYMYKTYGAEKFKDFVRGFDTVFSLPALFKRVFDITISTAFENFMVSFKPIPLAPSEPFVRESGRFGQIVTNGESIYYVDSLLTSVFKFDSEGNRAFMSYKGRAEKIAVSSSGSYFAAVLAEGAESNLHLYEIANERPNHRYTYNSVYDMAFVRGIDKYLLALYKYEPLNRYIEFVDLVSQKVLGRLDLGMDSAFSLTEYDINRVAFIKKGGVDYSVCIYDVVTGELFQLENDEKLLMHNLSFNDSCGTLSFSYFEKASDGSHNPRFAEYYMSDDGNWRIRKAVDDVDGGFLYPVHFFGRIIYKSEKYKYDRLMQVACPELGYTESVAELKLVDISSAVGGQSAAVAEPQRHAAFAKSFPFASRGLFYPVFENNAGVGIGLQYYTIEPSEQYSSRIGAAYYFGEKQRIDFNYYHYFESRKYNAYINLKPQIKFDNGVHFDMLLQGSFAYTKYFSGDSEYLKASVYAGYDLPIYESSIYEDDGMRFAADLYFSSLRNVGYGFGNVFGFTAELYGYVSDMNRHFKENGAVRVSPSVDFAFKFHCPYIIPVSNSRNLTYNLPFRISLLANYKYNAQQRNRVRSDHNVAVSLKANMILFAADISEYMFDVPFVIKNFVLEFGAGCSYLNYTSMKGGTDDVYRGFVFDFTLSAYFRLNFTFLGTYVTYHDFDIGFACRFSQQHPNDAFGITPAFLLRLNGDTIFGFADKYEF